MNLKNSALVFALRFFGILFLFALVYFALAVLIDETCSRNVTTWEQETKSIVQEIPHGPVKAKKAAPKRTEDIVMPKVSED